VIGEPFSEGNSCLHRSSPLTRVVMAVLFSAIAALIHRPAALLIALGFASALAVLARLPAVMLGSRLAAAFGLLLLICALVPWTYPGEPVAKIAGLTFTEQGIWLCLQITLKTVTILIAFTALVATMRLSTLGHTLHRLGVPPKLVQLLLLSYRYIFVIEQEYQRLYRAARMRNFHPGNNLHTYRTYAYLLGMLFVRASERATRVYNAMKCRGFDGRFHSLEQYAASPWNAALPAFTILTSLVLIILEAGVQ